MRRIAILPANILIADPDSQWLSVALPVVLEQDLAASAHTVAFIAATESVALQGSASQALRMTAEIYRGHFEITATLTGTGTQKATQVWKVRRAASDPVVFVANELARQVDPAAGSFAITSDRALRLFTQAVQAQDAKTRIGLLQQAIEAGPRFGLAYVALLNTLAATRDPSLPQMLSQAAAQAGYFARVDRARIDALRLRLSNAPLATRAQADAAVLKYSPNDIEQLTALASDRYLQGDAAEAGRLMQRAWSISPGSISVRQQYARGLVETRRFREAEKLLAGIENNPVVLVDIAFCALLQGDRTRADGLVEKFFTTVPNPDLKIALHATWFAASGDVPKAVAMVQSATFQQPGIRSIALSQAAVWEVLRGDFDSSQKLAAAAQEASPSPAAVIARLLSRRPASAAAWRAEVGQASQNTVDQRSKDLLVAYGYFLFGFYSDSAGAWQALLDGSGNTDLAARAMLAASLRAAGRAADARKILVEPFLPDLGDFYASIPFTEMRALEGQPGR